MADKQEVVIKTGEGQVIRLGPLLSALNRQIAKRRKEIIEAEGTDVPIYIPNPKPIPQAIEEVTDHLLKEYQRYEGQFPGASLGKWLDHRAAEVMKEAWKNGKPIAREDVRRALAAMYAQAQRQRGESKPVVISTGNRKQRRELSKKTKREVVKV